jgi:succinylglutamic semialdehyde dehydrogenase
VAGAKAITRYKPHGVVAVFGPFNFPAHLPNGHILPALLAGNAVIFKPSEQTPLVGELYGELFQDCGLPAGALNLLQGGRETGVALASHAGIDGIFFTGSSEAGIAISKASQENPGKILALEMGGNNPLLVHRISDFKAAAYWTIQSAFITSGQRCSCARRLIVINDAEGDAFLAGLVSMTGAVRVGPYTQRPEPFMGPVISPAAAKSLLAAQDELVRRGARQLLVMQQVGESTAMLTPGLIDVTEVNRTDVEVFGPLLQIIRVKNFHDAIDEANKTRYGLTAALFSDDRALFDQFYRRIRAGVVNFNRPTTGATGHLPFGGIGWSGNHRPSGYFAVDYCSYAVASMESPALEMPKAPSPGIVLAKT